MASPALSTRPRSNPGSFLLNDSISCSCLLSPPGAQCSPGAAGPLPSRLLLLHHGGRVARCHQDEPVQGVLHQRGLQQLQRGVPDDHGVSPPSLCVLVGDQSVRYYSLVLLPFMKTIRLWAIAVVSCYWKLKRLAIYVYPIIPFYICSTFRVFSRRFYQKWLEMSTFERERETTYRCWYALFM